MRRSLKAPHVRASPRLGLRRTLGDRDGLLGGGHDEHLEPLVATKAKRAAADADDAWAAGPQHLKSASVAQADLSETLNVVHLPEDRRNERGLAATQGAERDAGINHEGLTQREAVRRDNAEN